MSDTVSRQVALDLETTGLTRGNRIIEVGCVEIVNRSLTGRVLQHYVNPDCKIEKGATRIHGITAEQLVGKPMFSEILEDVLEFVKDAEVLIHNASFDLGFLNDEMKLAKRTDCFEDFCLKITDTLVLAREKLPGGSSLDQLCDFYQVDRTQREVHGARLDADLLARVYLRMTGGQLGLSLNARTRRERRINPGKVTIPMIKASPDELRLHEKFMEMIKAQCAEGRKHV